MTWMQAKRLMFTGKSVRLATWPTGWQLSLSVPGNSNSEYVLANHEGVLDFDWVPDIHQLRSEWDLIVRDESHLWNAPF